MTKVAVLGGGGHAKVLISCLKLDPNLEITGIYDQDESKKSQTVLGISILGTEDELLEQENPELLLVNGLGTTQVSSPRHDLFEKFKDEGFEFLTVVHPSAIISEEVIIEEGAQIMAGVVLQPGCHIGANSILNTSCSIDHDCNIQKSCHIAPGAVLSGNVTVGERSHIGTGARVIQGVSIGYSATIAAGSTVIRDVPGHSVVKGTPAK